MSDQKNTILAIVLSALVLIGWQIFFGMPQAEKQRQIAQQQAQEPAEQQQTQPGAPGAPAQQQAPVQPGQQRTAPQAPGQAGPAAAQPLTREAALAASPRVRIDTPRVAGSINLKGARIDDLSLIKFRE